MYTKLAYLEDISVSPDVCLAGVGLGKDFGGGIAASLRTKMGGGG